MMMHQKRTPKTKVGLIGCGDIARKAYLPFSTTYRLPYEIAGCVDVRKEMASKLADDFALPRCYDSVEELLADPEIEVVLNLTHPAGHAPINLAALRAGKHAYCEKPFALNRDEGRAVLEEAAKQGLKVGCAPDTVLGSGTRHTRRLIDEGRIGKPWFARLQWMSAGPESWHPNPAFYYQPGGGPLLDMGPYYLSSLVQCLGPMKAVEGRAFKAANERRIGSQPLEGTMIPVETPTHYVGTVEMACGVVVQVLFSFDMKFGGVGGRFIEICGDAGRLLGTDPNRFDGVPEWNQGKASTPPAPVEEALRRGPEGRGLGLADLVLAIKENRSPRADGELAYHVLDAMLAFEESEKKGGRIELESTCARPLALPPEGLLEPVVG